MLLKSYKIIISEEVEINLQKQVDYITFEQQDPLAAQIWLDGIKKSIRSLSILPERFAVAHENSADNKRLKTTIRHLIYKKSFRIIFTIIRNEVIILNIKHSAQRIAIH